MNFQFPLNFNEISILFAVLSLILMVSSELLLGFKKDLYFPLDKIKIRRAAVIMSIFFIITAIIKMYQLILSV